MTDLADASSATRPTTSVPTSPDVAVAVAAPSPEVPEVAEVAGPSADMLHLLTAFRLFQMQHSRVVNHEGIARGLNATDVRLVFFLASVEGGATPKQAGAYLELSTGAMTSLIDRLVDRNHIERRPNPDDRRSVLLHLTPAGVAVATEIGTIYHAAFSAVIPVEHRAALAEAFERIGEELRRADDACGA